MKLRYGGGQTGMGKATPLEWNSETWRNLPKLRILSLEANLIGIFQLPSNLNIRIFVSNLPNF